MDYCSVVRGVIIFGFGFAAAAVPKPRHVIHIMADDLGYGDVGWRTTTTEKVESPTLDRMVHEGVEIPEHYSYKMCGPSRVSTLTGRYPYHAGYYNNNGGDTEGAPISYTMLPGHLQQAGWATHALGKWHAGWAFKNYTPTYRGFDTFLGSSGNLDGYWGSKAGVKCGRDATTGELEVFDGFDEDWAEAHPPGGHPLGGDPKPMARDLLRGVGPNITAARGYGEDIYDSRMYTEEALRLIAAHNITQRFYLYLAFHNVHVPIQFPLATAERYPHVITDSRKGTDAMLTELDWSVSNITAALSGRGMLNDTLFIFHSDNGGPGSHAVNQPHRGGKFSFWEGGVRTVAFVSWAGLPASVRGSRLKGMAHLTDWYMTIVEGIAGANATDGHGPVPPDGHNLWPALMGEVPASPRTEVVHMPSSNKYNNASYCRKGPGHGCSPAIRVGDLKLIVGWPGSDGLWTWDPLQHRSTPFGKEGGTCVNKTKCTAPHWKQMNPSTHQDSKCVPFCLFNLTHDLSEHTDLSADPSYKAHAEAMLARLREEAHTGIPLAYIPGADKAVTNAQCSLFLQTGFWLPSDMPGYTPGPTPSPGPPGPTPAKCKAAMAATCPIAKGEDYKKCRECCHNHVSSLGKGGAGCKPHDYNSYCNQTSV